MTTVLYDRETRRGSDCPFSTAVCLVVVVEDISPLGLSRQVEVTASEARCYRLIMFDIPGAASTTNEPPSNLSSLAVFVQSSIRHSISTVSRRVERPVSSFTMTYHRHPDGMKRHVEESAVTVFNCASRVPFQRHTWHTWHAVQLRECSGRARTDGYIQTGT